NVFIGGTFTTITPQAMIAPQQVSMTGVAQFVPTGAVNTNWNANLNSGLPTAAHALALSGTNLVVGGSFAFAGVGNLPRAGLAKIGRSSPAVVDPVWNPTATNQLATVQAYALAVSGTNLYVGGSFANIGGPVSLARMSLSGAGNLDTNWHPNP